MIQGQIIKALSGFYYVQSENQRITCKARGNFRIHDIKPVVGDYVLFTKQGKEGYIQEILPRKNILIRPPISNIDQALLIFSCREPDFSSLLLDKFLLVIESLQIEPIICLSKMDLESKQSMFPYIQSYQQAGYTVLPVSAQDAIGLEDVKELFQDRVTVITGQSGVGKSSLLNAIDASLQITTQGISKALGRGKHTTRHVELLPLFGGYVADTPGFSSLTLTMEPEQAAIAYRDFKKASQDCKFRGCLHLKEPHCAVKEAVHNGQISKERYEHYVGFMEVIKKRKEQEYG